MPTYRLFADNLTLAGSQKTYSVRCEQRGCFLGPAGCGGDGRVVSHLTLDQAVTYMQKQSPPQTDSVAKLNKHDGTCTVGTSNSRQRLS